MPRFLPDDWKGGFVLLVLVFVLSSFLDNIAAAMIGGTMARPSSSGKVHIGYLAAIVAASNAGGSGSVVGDTTTTMMWIAGVDPPQVLDAYVGGGPGLLFFGVPAALQQQAYQPIVKGPADAACTSTGRRVAIVAIILLPRRSSPTSIAQPATPGAARPLPGDRRGRLGRVCCHRRLARARLERAAGSGQGQRSSCCRWCCAPR